MHSPITTGKYLKAGNRENTIILLHGWGLNKGTWKNALCALSAQHTVYALDLPGFGDNQDLSTVFTLRDYVRYIEGFLDAGPIEKAIIVGHSFGAMVASSFAVAFRARVEKLVLYSGGLTISYSGSCSNIFGRLVMHALVLFSVLTRWYRNRAISGHDYCELLALYKSLQEDGEFHGDAMLLASRCLIIGGRFDFLVPLGRLKQLTRLLPNSIFVEFRRSGHCAHIIERRRFLRVLSEFIAEDARAMVA